MMSFRETGLLRDVLAAAFLLGIAGASRAQAPGSAFGQSPRQIQQNLTRPSPQLPPAKPLARPAVKAPNWNAAGPNTAPGSLSPPPASGSALHPVQALNRIEPSNKARAWVLSKEKLTKFEPHRTTLLQAQTKIRDEQNRIALSLKGQWHMASPGPAAPSSSAFAAAPGRTSSLGANAAARSPLLARNARTQDTLASQPDGIWFVNNKARDFVITPGGNVVIFGKGFGERAGQVFAKGLTGFPGGAAALQVTAWSNFEIDAVLPAGIRGVRDLSGVATQVVTPAGKSFTLGNGRFFAAREEIVLTTNLDRLIEFQMFGWTTSEDASVTSDTGSHPNVLDTNGNVRRLEAGISDFDCERSSHDILVFSHVPAGFTVSGIAFWSGRTDAGDGNGYGGSGNRMYFPGYSLGDFYTTSQATNHLQSASFDAIQINWGVWRSHNSAGSFSTWECSSNYQVAVSLVGPAGISPF